MANTAITSLQLNSGDVHYITSAFGTCTTAAATAAKVVTVDTTKYDFALVEGVRVTVRFSNNNTASTPTLNVNSTGAKGIKYRNSTTIKGASSWRANDIIEFVYDGTNWLVLGGYDIPAWEQITDVEGEGGAFMLTMLGVGEIGRDSYLMYNPRSTTLSTNNLRVNNGYIYFGEDYMSMYADGGNCIYFTDGEEAGSVELDNVMIYSSAIVGSGITSNDSSLATNRLRASKIYDVNTQGVQTTPPYNGSITWFYE